MVDTAQVPENDTRQRVQGCAHAGGERDDAVADRVQAQRQRIVHRRAEAEHRGVVELPVLEAPRVGPQLAPIEAHPWRGMMVDHRRLEALVEQLLPDVEEAGAARPAQVLAARRGEKVAAELLHVQRHLTHGLAGVEQVEDAMLAGDGADLSCGVDKAAVGRGVRDRDQPAVETRWPAVKLQVS